MSASLPRLQNSSITRSVASILLPLPPCFGPTRLGGTNSPSPKRTIEPQNPTASGIIELPIGGFSKTDVNPNLDSVCGNLPVCVLHQGKNSGALVSAVLVLCSGLRVSLAGCSSTLLLLSLSGSLIFFGPGSYAPTLILRFHF